jgi:thioredoxin 1
MKTLIRPPFAALALGLAGLITLPFTGCGQRTEAGDTAATESAPPAAAAAPATATAASAATSTAPAIPAAPAAEKRLPRLVDIGAGTCIPCKMMKPILEELQATRAHQFETVFIDLNHQRDEATRYKIRVIPTQIFFDENGREYGRHEGFMSKEQILDIWKQLGYEFGG